MEESLSSSKLKSAKTEAKEWVLNVSSLIKVFAGLTLISFYLNLALGCKYVFTCDFFTPSPHYLGSFLGFNRFYVLSFVLLSITLGLTYLGACLKFSNRCNKVESLILKGVGVFTTISIPIISLTNEFNAAHVVPFDRIYSVLSYLTFIANIAWIWVFYSKASKIPSDKLAVNLCSWVFGAILALTVFVAAQRYWNYKKNNWIINTTLWSVSEWGLMTLVVIFLPFVASINSPFQIIIGNYKFVSEDTAEIELGELVN